MGVDADHVEGPESNHVVIEDTDPPEIASVDTIPSGSLLIYMAHR